MTSTYKSAFKDPKSHQAVVKSLKRGASSPDAHPGSSSKLAKEQAGDDQLAVALQAEEEGRQSGRSAAAANGASTSGRSAAPKPPGPKAANGAQVHHQHAQSAPASVSGPWAQQQPQRRSSLLHAVSEERSPVLPFGDGDGAAEDDGALAARLQDEELAAQMQGVELVSAIDGGADLDGHGHGAHGGRVQPVSLLFPGISLEPSTREQALNQTLSRAPSIKIQPSVLSSAVLPPLPPCDDSAPCDVRARLLSRLDTYCLVEKLVQGDGNCQFRALSDQLYGSPEYHMNVRKVVAGWLARRKAEYGGYVPGNYNHYCAAMSRNGTWGDHLTLQAAADHYGMRIIVLSSYQDGAVISIDPQLKRSNRTLYISFWAEVHYNSLYPASEPPKAAGDHYDDDDLQAPTPRVLGSKTLAKVFGRGKK